VVTVELRRLRADEGPQLRAVRLRALRDAPSAFASTAEAEEAQPSGDWELAAARRATSDTEATFVAVDGGTWVGLAGAYVTGDPARSVELVSMWTAPEHRGEGIGRGLVEAVIAWASSVGAETVGLCVTEGNHPATRLYDQTGFEATGECRPLPSDPARTEVRMRRRIEPAADPQS
jgi:GNAT superfamily N-acetyltransferase